MARQYLDLAQVYGAVDQANANKMQAENQRLQQQRFQRQMSQEDAELARQEGIRNAYRGAIEQGADGSTTLNRKKALDALYGLAPEEAMKAQEGWTKSDSEASKIKREEAKADIEGRKAKTTYLRDRLAGVRDQQSFDAVLAEANELGATSLVQALGNQYNPEAVRQQLYTADEYLKQSKPDYQKIDRGGRIEIVDMNPVTNPAIKGTAFDKTATIGEQESQRHNRVQEGISDAQLGVSRDRLAFEKIGGVAGVVPAAGKPVKLTEDQGKATGWLSQANNAYANMKNVMVDKDGFINKDVVKPGALEAGLTNLGLEGTANYSRSGNRQKFVQATESMSESLLRAATGAGVNKDEARQKTRELLPQWSDSDDLIKQKLEAIPVYLDSLKVRAGAGANTLTNNQAPLDVKLPDNQSQRGKVPTIKQGTIGKSKSGKPTVFMNGRWEYVNG